LAIYVWRKNKRK